MVLRSHLNKGKEFTWRRPDGEGCSTKAEGRIHPAECACRGKASCSLATASSQQRPWQTSIDNKIFRRNPPSSNSPKPDEPQRTESNPLQFFNLHLINRIPDRTAIVEQWQHHHLVRALGSAPWPKHRPVDKPQQLPGPTADPSNVQAPWQVVRDCDPFHSQTTDIHTWHTLCVWPQLTTCRELVQLFLHQNRCARLCAGDVIHPVLWLVSGSVHRTILQII